MIGTTQSRMLEISRRVRRKRMQREKSRCISLACATVLTAGAMGMFLHDVQSPGIATVHSGYGAVMIRSDVSSYVVVGILVFTAGVVLSVIGIRLRDRQHHHSVHTDEGEETL